MGRTISFTEVGEFDAPPERMFWFMVDPANASRVDPSIVSWQPRELPPRVGTHNDLVGKGPLGIKMRVVSKFTEFDPPHRMVVESVMPARPVFVRGIHDVEPLDGGRCRYTYTLEFTPSRGGALMARDDALVDAPGRPHRHGTPDPGSPPRGRVTAQPVGSVKSADGTAISYIRTGNGPPLVMVPSVSADHSTFGSVAPLLAEHFTLYMIDRRGRGASGDAPNWSIEREYQDVVAVIDSIAGPVSLLGYSWSVILCLEAALLTSNIAKLVLYEPGFQAAYDPYPDGWIEKAEALLEAGDREGVVLALVRLAGLSDEEIATMRAGPSWAARVEIAHTIPRECRHDATYVFEPERFAALRIPTLLLVGTATPEIYRRSVSDVHAALPDSRDVTLEGLGHGAHHAAPDRLAAEVVRFLV